MDVIIPLIAYDRRMRMVLERRLIRDVTNPFNVPQTEFCSAYRLPQYLARNLIREIEPFGEHIPQGIPFHLQVLCALNFFAGGSYQNRVGRDIHNCMSQSIVSRCVREFSKIISINLGPKYVKFPTLPDEIESTKQNFLDRYGVPGILGLVDCTHVPLAALKNDIEIAYINRKGFHSINVQIISDANNLIRSVNARYPGSLHDSFIWKNSQVFTHLQRQYSAGIYDEYLFGDSGYPLQPWLLIPIPNPADRIDRFFNKIHRSIRSGVERTIGLLKGRFRCLLCERKLRYKPSAVLNIVNSCAVLHNILVSNHVPFVRRNMGNMGEIVPVADALPDEYRNVGNDIRRYLAEQIY